MDVEQYRCFLMVANCGNISEAARQLNIAQPALSTKIKKMSEELGTELFIKKQGSHKIHLSPAGSLVYAKAQQICALENSLRNELHESNTGLRGLLRIQLFPWEKEVMLYNIVKGFHELYPLVKFDIFEFHQDSQANRNLECDLALLAKKDLIHYQHTKDIIGYTQVHPFAIVAADNPWFNNSCTKIDIQDLDDVPIIIPSTGFGNDFVSNMLYNKLHVNVVGYAHYRPGGIYMARANIGVHITITDIDKKYYPDLRFIPIKGHALDYFAVIAKEKGKELSPLMQRFIEYRIKNSFADNFIPYTNSTPLK